MKITTFVFAAIVLFSGCRPPQTMLNAPSRSFEYHIDGSRYAIVIVRDGLSEEKAKEIALEKAAAMTVANGYRYFTVESQSDVSVVKSDKQFPSEQAQPRNIYYELIQSGNFGRAPIRSGDFASLVTTTGYRITFFCSQEKASEKALDACAYNSCKQE